MTSRFPLLHDGEWLAEQFAAQRLQREIADELGCDQSMVSLAAKQFGLRSANRRQVLIERDWLAAQRAAGREVRDIAAELGCGKNRVAAYIHRYGLQVMAPKRHNPGEDREWLEARLHLSLAELAAAAGGVDQRYQLRRFGLRDAHRTIQAQLAEDRRQAREIERQEAIAARRRARIRYPQLRDRQWLVDNAHMGVRGIAEETGADQGLVSRALRKHGVQLPPRPPDRLKASLTAEDRTEAISRHRLGHSTAKISRDLHISPSTVFAWTKSADIASDQSSSTHIPQEPTP